MATTTTTTNKPLNPRAQDLSPKGYNRANIFSGKALDFDGVNDTLSTDYAPSSNIQTAAYWVKLDSLTTNYTLGGFVGSSDQFGLYYWGENANKNFGFNTWNGDSYGVTLPDFVDDYFHVVAEYNFTDFTQSKLFVNGQELSISQTHGTTLQRTTASRTFKFDSPSATSQEVNAQINGVKVFEGSLTAAQVADLYLNPEKIVPDGVADCALKLWLPMMEGAGASAYDGSGNGNDGTINGATWTAGIGAPVAQTALVSWNKGQNLLVQSENFGNSWSVGNTTISSNAATAPNGTTTAEGFTSLSTTANHVVYQIYGSAPTTSYTFTAYVKKVNSDFVYIKIAGGSSLWVAAVFNLNTGAVTKSEASGWTGLAASSQDVGNGWYLLKVSGSGSVDASFNAGIQYTNTGTPTFTTYADFSCLGSGVLDYYVWGASLRPTSAGDAYIKTNATAQTSDVLVPEGLTAGASIFGTDIITPRNAFALNLDGASWAEVHDNASLDFGSSSWTMECWIDWTPTDGKGIMSRWYSSERAMLLYTSASIYVRLFTGTVGGAGDTDLISTPISDGWHHIIGTFTSSDSKLRLYIDGSLNATSGVISNAYNSNVNPLEIGRFNNSTSGTYTNAIANPRIYNRALTAAEVLRNYNADRPKFGL